MIIRCLLLIFHFSLFSFHLQGQNITTDFKFDTSRVYKPLEIIERLKAEKYPLVYSTSKLPETEIIFSDKVYTQYELFEYLKNFGIEITKYESSFLVRFNSLPLITISGYIKSKDNGEVLIGASILADKNIFAFTNGYGFFSLNVKPGEYKLQIKHVGYKQQTLNLLAIKNQNLIIELTTEIKQLDNVVVNTSEYKEKLNEKLPGSHKLTYSEKGTIPYFMGEVDVLQEAILLPGISTLGEDASGINVRGSNIDQNLYLLDEAIIYNPNHFYGLISVFNPEALNQVDIYKGYVPPSFGGRTSSVFRIYQKEGNYNRYSYSGGIGFVSARAMIEGPIVKEKASFLISGRQSLFDISRIGQSDQVQNSRNSFQDLNLKVNYRLNERNTFYLSGYLGNDRNQAGFDAVRNWGNRALTFRWNHTFSPRIFSHFSLLGSEYDYRISNPVEAGSFIGTARNINYSLKIDNHFYQSQKSHFEFGFSSIFHRIKPGERIPFDENSSQSEPIILDSEHGLESSIYITHNYKLNPKINLNYGFRLSNFLAIGDKERYIYSEGQPRENEYIIDTISYDNGEIFSQNYGFEPRVSINFSLSDHLSVKPAFSRIYQFLQLLSNTAAPSPTDIWKLTDDYIQPLRTDQYSIGLYKEFPKLKLTGNIDLFYKDIENILDFKDGADLIFNPNIETEILQGSGRAYGMEMFLRKNTGRLTGWLSYTLSRAEKRIVSVIEEETINGGDFFPEDYDKTHDLSVVGIYQINQRLSISSSFNFSTGRPFTYPTAKYYIENILVPHFEDRNQDRLPNYHRMDLTIKLLGKQFRKNGEERKLKDYWTLNLYNVYARNNVYSYFFRQSELEPNTPEIIEFSIFRTIIPSLTYNFKF